MSLIDDIQLSINIPSSGLYPDEVCVMGKNVTITTYGNSATLNLFIYLGFLRCFQHCTGHITMGSWKGRGNQYIEFARILYCKLPTNGKQLPAFPHKALTGIEPRPQRWEARVLPLCHLGPLLNLVDTG